RITTGTNQPIADNTTIDGIPFYPKRAVCRQDTVWLEPVYVLTREDTYLEKQPTTEPPKPGTPPPAVTKTSVKPTKMARRAELTRKPCPAGPPRAACAITTLDKLDALQKALADAQPTIDQAKLDKINDAWNAINVTKSLLVSDVEQRNVVLARNTLTSDFFVD